MVMPLWDHSPFKWPTPPYVMWRLIVVNFVVFFWIAGLAPDRRGGRSRAGRPDPGGVLRRRQSPARCRRR